MLSIDTNLLFHAYNRDSPSHRLAFRWLSSIDDRQEVVISEFVLVELYGLLRNPAVLDRPLPAPAATEVVQAYRAHPRWRLVGFTAESRPLHDRLWAAAAANNFAFRRIYDSRTALTLIAHGVTDFATANVKDFSSFGFVRVWNPTSE